MKTMIAVLALLSATMGFAQAKNYAVPSNDPAITMALPDDWETESIQFGFSASDPDEEVFVYVESAGGKKVEQLAQVNADWLKEQGIKATAKAEKEGSVAGLPAQIIRISGTDDDGDDTNVTFFIIDAGKNRIVMLTVRASDEAEKTHERTLNAIFDSIKAIN